MRLSIIATALTFLGLCALSFGLAPRADAAQIYKENFNNGQMPPQGWTLNPPQFTTGDYVWDLFNAKAVCPSVNKKKESFRQEKVGATLPIGSTAALKYDITLGSAISSGGNETTIEMSAAFCYNNNGSAPSIGNNFFCWNLTGGPSEFRICLSEGYDLSVNVGGSGGFSVGSTASYEKQWITLTVYYTLGKLTALAIVNAGGNTVARTVDMTIMQPDPMDFRNMVSAPYPFTSATGSNLYTAMNFNTPQTGAIYIDDMLLNFLKKTKACSELNAFSGLGNSVTVAMSAAGC